MRRNARIPKKYQVMEKEEVRLLKVEDEIIYTKNGTYCIKKGIIKQRKYTYFIVIDNNSNLRKIKLSEHQFYKKNSNENFMLEMLKKLENDELTSNNIDLMSDDEFFNEIGDFDKN